MQRSLNFSDALLRLDPAAASATTGPRATMPGVTTMWLGTAARAAWALGMQLRLTEGEATFTTSAVARGLAQLAVAFATSALIGLVVLLAWWWASPVAAVAMGALLASEPFVVAHGAVLHTDELTGLFGAGGVLALLLALGIPARSAGRPRARAALGGALLGGALLTKLTALVLLPGVALVASADVLRALVTVRHGTRQLGRQSSLLALACGVAVAVVLLAWPAIWADPLRQLDLLRQSAALARTPLTTFFLGHVTGTPGPLFYAVATPLRMTPWFLLAVLVLIPLALVRGQRRHAVILLVIIAPVVAVLSVAARQADRYVLVALPLAALAVGLGIDAVLGRIRTPCSARPRLALAAGLTATALLVAHAAWIAPWGLAYFNPLLGGSKTAERTILIGWGEGLELAGEWIRQREAPGCEVTVAFTHWTLSSAFPCGTITGDTAAADYVVLYVHDRQGLPNQVLANLHQRGQLVDVVTIRGINYAEIYDMRTPSRREVIAPARAGSVPR